MKKILTIFTSAITLVMLAACSASVPEKYTLTDELPDIYPDYIDVTIPANIAPLTFEVRSEGEKYITRLSHKNNEIVIDGNEVMPDGKAWSELTGAAQGDTVKAEIFVKRGGEWLLLQPFTIICSPDLIDEYISYRLIPPSYVAYEELTINQRNLTNYDEEVIYSNMLAATDASGQCINCHAYKNYRTDNMQFHMRQGNGGTMFVHNGKAEKIDLSTSQTLSAGVYPAFNPVYDVVAYSVNKTGQIFHTRNENKVEVQDEASDLILYNPQANYVTNICSSPLDLEVFPWWSPDGRTLYYCSARFEVLEDKTAINEDRGFDTGRFWGDKTVKVGPRRLYTAMLTNEGGWDKDYKFDVRYLSKYTKEEQDSIVVASDIQYYRKIQYNVLRRSWNPETFEFGEIDTVFKATNLNRGTEIAVNDSITKEELANMLEMLGYDNSNNISKPGTVSMNDDFAILFPYGGERPLQLVFSNGILSNIIALNTVEENGTKGLKPAEEYKEAVIPVQTPGMSATFPRVSPDGRFLLISLGNYGCFQIWHKESDLYLIDLESVGNDTIESDGVNTCSNYWALENANSEYPESYHSWSSNGRWILYASRRDDGNYSRLYIAHIDNDGKASKGFLLPQASPRHYDFFDCSYNVPEFMVEPVKISPEEFAEISRAKGNARKAKYSNNGK